MYSHYHHTGRRIFFWTLVVAYVCLIGIIIPYAFGYRFSFDRGVFVYAGSITVKANPRTVTVTIDDHTDDNPSFINDTYHITGIAPGEHTVHITRDGFQPVTKTITVSSGISTELWNVILPRTTYTRTPLATLPTHVFYRAPRRNLIAVPFAHDDDRLGVTILDVTDPNNVRTTTRTPFPQRRLTPDTAQNVEWSRDATALIVPVTHTRADGSLQSDALILTPDDTLTLSLRDVFPAATTIDTVRWHPQKSRTLYAHIDDTLTEITLPETDVRRDTVRTTPRAGDVRAYTIAGNALYYLTRRTGVIIKLSQDGSATQITTTPTTLSPDDDAVVTVYDDNRVVVRGTRSGTLEFFDGARPSLAGVLARNIRGSHFSNDGKKLLYWSDNEIFVRFVRDWDVQPLRTAGETLTLARFTTPVDNVQWTADYEHVLYTTPHALKLTSLDGRGGRTTHTLLQLRTPSVVRADHAASRLFITEADGNAHPLFFITFPEKEGLF